MIRPRAYEHICYYYSYEIVKYEGKEYYTVRTEDGGEWAEDTVEDAKRSIDEMEGYND